MAKEIEKLGDKAGDEVKSDYFYALNVYNYVSEKLGPNSPAKTAAKALIIQANAEAALQNLTTNIVKAKDLKGVMKYVALASKNTSPLPALLEDARTTDDILSVLRIIKEDKDLARSLSKTILASTKAEEVANAFADIAEKAATAGIEDPELILFAKLDSQVKKFVMNADLQLSDVKSIFNREA